jgi:hypothetical protein
MRATVELNQFIIIETSQYLVCSINFDEAVDYCLNNNGVAIYQYTKSYSYANIWLATTTTVFKDEFHRKRR